MELKVIRQMNMGDLQLYISHTVVNMQRLYAKVQMKNLLLRQPLYLMDW